MSGGGEKRGDPSSELRPANREDRFRDYNSQFVMKESLPLECPPMLQLLVQKPPW